MKLVKMTRHDGHKVDVHPTMVDDYRKGAYVVDDDQGGPLDHDNDGKPGGSTAPEQTDDMAKLRAEYQDLIGKRPFPGWDADELQKRIDAKLDE